MDDQLDDTQKFLLKDVKGKCTWNTKSGVHGVLLLSAIYSIKTIEQIGCLKSHKCIHVSSHTQHIHAQKTGCKDKELHTKDILIDNKINK